MAECPGGRTNRGTRSQFRLGTPGSALFKGLHPIHLGDIMDSESPSSKTGVLSARNLVSPSRGTRTLTVREYEQTIDELKKENFDLKLRLHLLEESIKRNSKDKESGSPDKNTVQVVVQLKLETESLRKDLAYKEKVLQDALEQVEKYKLDFTALEEKYAELQNDLASLSELPSKEEFLLLAEEKESLLKQNESLEQVLIEKNQEIQDINTKIEILANQNILLEEKIKKRSLAIQGFVYKNLKEKEMLPDELRNVVLSATQAAKSQNKENLAIAVKSINSVLNQMMYSAVKIALNESEEKENIGSPQGKCLKEEFLEKSSAFLPSHTEPFTELNHIESLKEALVERNTPGCKLFESIDSTFYSPAKEKMNESFVNIPEKDVVECVNIYSPPTKSAEANSVFSNEHSSHLCPDEGNKLVNLEAISSPSVPVDKIYHNKNLSEREKLLLTRKENEKLKLNLKEKLVIIQNLTATCKELELKAVQKRENDALKASKRFSVYTQTDIVGSNLLKEYEIAKLQNDAKLSSNVEELREDVLLLLLAMEDKNKELGDVKQTLSAVQDDLNRALNASSNILDQDYMNERNELHERLAFSCSVNVELIKHLRNLETFMEDLLQHKLDSSMESISGKSDFMSSVSKCLTESLKLSNVLSDHLSICEGSKLFEECESVLYKNSSYNESHISNGNLSEMNIPAQRSLSYPGTHHLEEYIPLVRKSDEKMGTELDSSQLCWRCWQQLNSFPSNHFEVPPGKQSITSKCAPYLSSDSDIWSEPDRNVSMQRIGISLQNSPVASKSPRKLKSKERRMSNKLSSAMDTSSSETQHWSKQRRHGSVSRRLFTKEGIKNQDFTSEKFYFLLAEKYSKLKSLCEALENAKDNVLSDEMWIRMNGVIASVGEALQKLHIAKENAKNFPSAICGKCIMLDLFIDLKTSHREYALCLDDSSFSNELLVQFEREVQLLKEVCKEPFLVLPESIDQRSQSTQSNFTLDNEQVKISELEDFIVELNGKNKTLNKSLEEMQKLLSEEKERLESVKSENKKLSNQIDCLKEKLSIMKHEKVLSSKNDDLTKEVMSMNRNKLELDFILKDLEGKKKESSDALDQLTAELQKKETDLMNLNVKCSEYEKELNRQIQEKKECEEKLTITELTLLGEKETHYNNIRDLNSEKNYFQRALTVLDNENRALEEETADLKSKLKSKCCELACLQDTIDRLQGYKERGSFCLESVAKLSQSVQCDFAAGDEQIKISELEDTIADLKNKNKDLSICQEEVKLLLSKQKEVLESVRSENVILSNQIENLKGELSAMEQKEKDLSLKNENLVKELFTVNKNNLELNAVLKDLEEKRKESSATLDQLTAELQKNKSDLVKMNVKCQEYENQLNEQTFIKQKYGAKLRELETASVSEKAVLSNFEDLNSHKQKSEKEILDKENAELRSSLETKYSEVSALQQQIRTPSSEPFLFSPETSSKKSQSSENDSVSEKEQMKISELEAIIEDLNDKNNDLKSSLEEVKMLLAKEKEMLESVKSENGKLSSQIEDMKKEILMVKKKEEQLSLKNKDLILELTNVNKNKSELSSTLIDLQKKSKESNVMLDQLSAELEKNKSDLANMNVKCLELEKELSEQMLIKEDYEKKLKNLESTSLHEKEELFNNISHLNSEKNYYQEELKFVKTKQIALEKENEALNGNLKSKISELSSLQGTIKELQETKERLTANYKDVQNELKNTKEHLLSFQEKYDTVFSKMKANEDYCQQMKQFEMESSKEKEKLLAKISKITAERENTLKKMNVEKENYERLLVEKNKLNENFSESCLQISSLKQLIDEEKNKHLSEKLSLKKENTALSANLESKCLEIASLQETVKQLQEAKETLSSDFKDLETHLQNTKKDLQTVQEKYKLYEEEVLVKFRSNEAQYCHQLKQLQAESLNEKKKLLDKIHELTQEREDIYQKLKSEKENYEKLMVEKDKLNKNFTESSQQISSLKLLNEELKNKQQSLLERNKFFENALHSSNSECNKLSNDLKCMRETLQNLESKCMVYERDLVAAAGMNDSLVECLIKIRNEFLIQRKKLNEIYKSYSSKTNVCEEIPVSELIPVIDEDNVKRLCDNLSVESKKLLQSIDMLLDLLKTYYLKSIERKNAEENFDIKTASMRKQLEFYKAESEHVKSQNDNFQQVIDELQKSILEKEKSVQSSAIEIQSLKEKIHNSKEEIEKGDKLLKRKDDEITMLQERVFNLQSFVNTILADKTNLPEISQSKIKQLVHDEADSIFSANQLPSLSTVKQVSRAIQVSVLEDSVPSDESFMSSSAGEVEKNSCCKMYLKKYHSLQTKYTFCKKRLEILEEEKNDLKDLYLNQLQRMKSSTSLEKEKSANTIIADLESKLEQKKLFINELKADLLKTCNSLIDKEKEVDDLKEKLSQHEKSKCTAFNMSDHSTNSPKSVETNIKSLRSYKWTLIQTIFDIQKKFYEKRGIHLNYFDTFRDHVNNLYSKHLTHSLSKSESMPILESHILKQQCYQGEDRLKNLVGLEVDIECLENLKIFLNRFFVPCVLQTSQNLNMRTHDSESEEKGYSTAKFSSDAEREKLSPSKLEKITSFGFLFPHFATDHLSPEYVQSSQTCSFEKFVSNVSHHLDCIENFFIAIRKCQWLENLDLSARESVDKAEVKSLLLKIFQEVKVLQEGADKLFSLNALLKNFDFVVTEPILLSSSRPDVSDRESLMSEETLGISRSESPLSVEDICPLKLPYPDTEEKTVKTKSQNGKRTTTESYSAKVPANIGSSCDSVCQRSHYSSPDLGIESDPNHESSAPEQKEENENKYQRTMAEKKFVLKGPQKTLFTNAESAGRFTGMKFGETLYSIGQLPHYELLKREIQESLVGIKSVLSRTGDGLHHVAKYTSPRKTLEYSTLKAIKDSCANIEMCLKEAYSLIGKFWIAPCPSEKEWKALIEENQNLIEQLASVRASIQKQESEFKNAMGKLEHAQLLKANMEKKISKKLVKTKKVIRQAELKLLESRCQNLRPVPKYPFEQVDVEEQEEV